MSHYSLRQFEKFMISDSYDLAQVLRLTVRSIGSAYMDGYSENGQSDELSPVPPTTSHFTKGLV